MNEIKNESIGVRIVQKDLVTDIAYEVYFELGNAYEVYLELKKQYPQQILLIETSHPNGYVCFDDDAKTASKIIGEETYDFKTPNGDTAIMFGVFEHELNEMLEQIFVADADAVVCIRLDKNEK